MYAYYDLMTLFLGPFIKEDVEPNISIKLFTFLIFL